MKIPSSTTWKLSQSLTRAELLKIAVAVGAPMTGTKPQILSNIHNAIEQTRKSFSLDNESKGSKIPSTPLRVLSIDMGVRNLAYALLERQRIRSDAPRISLIKWQRLSLEKEQRSTQGSKQTKKVDSSSKDDSLTVKEVVKECFEPADLAIHACRLARQFTDFRPTHILIERQRFRSAGQAAVQEWSLRVGMLEAMLHATFRILVEEKLLVATVESVLPARVNKYWFNDLGSVTNDVVVEGRQQVPTAKKAKSVKITMVTEMLQNLHKQTAPFTLDPDLHNVSKAFLQTRGTAKSSTEKNLTTVAPAAKLDDLSDCLLQALAWLHWQENRLKIT